jgi:hypothetical protein
MKSSPSGIFACLAAIAALVLLAAFVTFRYMQVNTEASLARQEAELASVEVRNLQQRLEAERILSQRQIQVLNQSGGVGELLITKLSSPGGVGAALGVVIWNPATQQGILVPETLPTPDEEYTYQIWLQDRGSDTPVPAGTFLPETGTMHRVEFHPVQRVPNAAEIRLTLEKKPGGAKPRGAVMASGQF